MSGLSDLATRYANTLAEMERAAAAPPKCPACEDTRFEPVPRDDGYRMVRRCTKCRGINSSADCRDCPAPLAGTRLHNYRADSTNQAALDTARAWLAAPLGDLYLYGGTGVGKTRLCLSLLNECADRHQVARFVRVALFLDRLRISMNGADNSEVEAQLLHNFFTVPVLGMDDIGADKGSDYGRRILQTILDQRLDAGLRTIWTSNLSLDKLAEFYGDERLASRLAGASLVAEVGGPDRRVA